RFRPTLSTLPVAPGVRLDVRIESAADASHTAALHSLADRDCVRKAPVAAGQPLPPRHGIIPGPLRISPRCGWSSADTAALHNPADCRGGRQVRGGSGAAA